MAETQESHESYPQESADVSSVSAAHNSQRATLAGSDEALLRNGTYGSARLPEARSEKGAFPTLRTSLRVVAAQDYIGVLIATVALVLGIGVIHPEFLAVGQLLDILNQATFVAVLACGMAFMLAMRELDLSVGSIYGLTSLCAAMLMHAGMPSWLGALGGLMIGALLGLINGLVIQWFRLPSIVATLATMSIFRGLIFALSDGKQVIGLSLTDPFAELIGAHFLGIPTNVWVMILVVAILSIVLRMTPFGYRVRSIGSNPDAAIFSGLPVLSIQLLVFILMGALGGLAGILSLGYFGSSDPNLGTGYELLAIAAAVIGGTSLHGGKATLIGAALGAILLGIVSSGLAYFNVPINWTAFATGAVILLAVSLDSLLRWGRTRRTTNL
ncbi:ABC transporter permease [Ktedonosporobacter rubrisoli]|uniref:Autoinducer 2 import system permease protein LsrC n=1 Tax=Ktedonosporobacter rubrisoli TaxID=2509675 RepID=A0A4P6JN05_KTERU|nr:ABC transporter permease [Ktedonosporobacter rubrisoli]QBD76677.1 ABC transporter permease [Ktedonosporobacter rubrisoli]